ncbi:MAG TPA: hypothetical protein DDY37_01765 [Legionella sp.]|nr:hypothetical protein [Legionella sp.]
MVSQSMDKDNLRGLRYCEIILAKTRLTFSVYTTIGLNDCPDAAWEKITTTSIKQVTGSYFVHLNGPRFFLMNGVRHTAFVDRNIVTLGGLEMREAGVLHLSLIDLMRGAAPYREHAVDRQTTWVYKVGYPVYELLGPQGQVFVMQSYSIEKSPLTEAQLAGLGDVLTLPHGWHFRTGVLKKDHYLTAIDNKAVVIQDNLLNTYQLATNDFLG